MTKGTEIFPHSTKQANKMINDFKTANNITEAWCVRWNESGDYPRFTLFETKDEADSFIPNTSDLFVSVMKV